MTTFSVGSTAGRLCWRRPNKSLWLLLLLTLFHPCNMLPGTDRGKGDRVIDVRPFAQLPPRPASELPSETFLRSHLATRPLLRDASESGTGDGFDDGGGNENDGASNDPIGLPVDDMLPLCACLCIVYGMMKTKHTDDADF